MAGHSKWANIKHRKAAQDAKRGEIFTKIRGLEAQFTVDVISAISMAAVIVNKNPRHTEIPLQE